jgi:alpha-ketoglutarate-dependent taurine dioxygenase
MEVSSLKEDLEASGYVCFKTAKSNNSSVEIASQLGIVDSVEGLAPVQTLIPRDQRDAPLNTYSGNFGRNEFPLHTDLAHWSRPPRYFLLRCIRGSKHVSTRLFDGSLVVRALGTDALRTAIVQPRRSMRNGKQLLPLLGRCREVSRNFLRWDSIYLRPASLKSSKVFSNVLEFLRACQPLEIFLLDHGDMLLVDNWRFLHGRSTAQFDDFRCIERIYLKEVR